MGEKDWIQQHRLVQERRDLIVIEVVARRRAPDAEVERLTAPMRAAMGPEMDLEVRYADAFELDSSGKFRLTIRRIDLPE